ncbi:CHRD domain-containing protein [Hymenobacter sp. GOD-10R]|uniref:CHRD domain-containing protein n=1 Tax=Hymenobacter sp. GOD-10R TaxID=3093922 RepID=UPI002D7747D7|nr:CHRD domain-containing protein [Hymenobacter sp. GOD-10R]WRQ28773.1 CHRD domain-containing protein [Hymenobacter sp. GOD-10R]
MLKKLITASLLATAALTFTGCKELLDEIILIGNPPASTKVNLTAVINSAQEVPANPSTATGTFTGVYDKATKVLTYTVTYQGLTPTAGHLHRGAPGTNGPVIYPFSSLASPVTGTATFTQADEDLLLNGGFYANFHTPAYPGGEIRGNIVKK